MNRTVYYTEPVAAGVKPCPKCGIACVGAVAKGMHDAGGCVYGQRDKYAREHNLVSVTELEKQRAILSDEVVRLREEARLVHELIDEAGGIPNKDERGELSLAQRVEMVLGDLASFERVTIKLSGKLTVANGKLVDAQDMVKKVQEEWGTNNVVARDLERIAESLKEKKS